MYDIPTRDFFISYNNLINSLSSPDVQQTLTNMKYNQLQTESQLLTQAVFCDDSSLGKIRDHIGSLDMDHVKFISKKYFYNINVMIAVACIIKSLFHISPYDSGTVYFYRRIRHFITNLRQISTDNVHLINTKKVYSLIADFNSTSNMLILKTVSDPKVDDLLHEAIVGIYGTNTLRKYIPNFVYIYGTFKCSPTLIDEAKHTVVSWCLHDQYAVNYIMYENISPSVSLTKYLETCTGKDIVNIYYQVLLALKIAHRYIDYTHYNLNTDKVLLKSLEEPDFVIPYESQFVRTKYVPTIIGYGFSHFKLNDVDLGKSDYVQYSIFPYRSWIMHDAYKLLMFSIMYALRFNNNSALTELNKIFRFFNKSEDPIVCINDQHPFGFSLPLNENSINLTLEDLCDYIRTVCNCDFILQDTTSYKILKCENGCLTTSEVLSRLGLDGPIRAPNNIIDFFDIYTKLHNQNRTSEKDQILQEFEYAKAIESHISIMKEIINKLIDLQADLKLIDVTLLNQTELFNYNTMLSVKSMYINIGYITDNIVKLRFYNRIGTNVANAYHDEKSIQEMKHLMDTFETQIKPYIKEAINVFTKNHDYLNLVPPMQNYIQEDPRLLWYWEDRLIFDRVFSAVIE